MRKAFIYILSLFIFAASSYAAITKVRVLDKTDNQPVAGALVEVPYTNIKVVTTDDGRFVLNGCSNIKISSVGYQSITVDLQDTISEVTVFLEPAIRDLETVVVTASRSEKKLKDVPVVTQVLYADKLQKLGINTVGAALEREVPGVNFSQNDILSKSTFQGLNARDFLILVDGERLSGAMDGDVDYNRLNLEQVERVEIVRGASSVLYGSSAIGGVINIITRAPLAKFAADAGIYYSLFNESRSNATVDLKKGRFASLTSVNYYRTDGYNVNPDSLNYKTQNKMYDMSVRQGLFADVSKALKVSVVGNAYYKRIYDGTELTSPSDHGYASYAIVAKAEYTHRDSSVTTFSCGVDDYKNYDVLYLLQDEKRKYASDNLKNYKLIHQFRIKKHQFIAGNETLYEKLFSIRITSQTKNLYESALFLQDEYNFGQKFQVTGGVRLTYNENYKTNIVPRLTFMYKSNPLIYRFSYGRGFRSPSLKELYYEFDHFGTFKILGNDSLKPEQSEYLSFSTEYNSRNYYIVSNFYANNLWQMIDYVNDTIYKVEQYHNVGRARILGVDLISGFKFFSKLSGNIGISLVDATDLSTKQKLYNISPVSITAGLTYIFNIGKYRQSLEAFNRFIGRREFTPVNERRYIDQPYQIVRITYSSALPYGFYATFGVDNVFDKVMPGSLGNTSPGRRLFFSLRYSFKKY